MKMIFESEPHGWGEEIEILHIYAIESEDEYEEINTMSFKEREEYFNIINTGMVAPGSMYTHYSIEVTNFYVVVNETQGYNV